MNAAPSQLPMTLLIPPAWVRKPSAAWKSARSSVKSPTCCPATVAIGRFTTSPPSPRRRHRVAVQMSTR